MDEQIRNHKQATLKQLQDLEEKTARSDYSLIPYVILSALIGSGFVLAVYSFSQTTENVDKLTAQIASQKKQIVKLDADLAARYTENKEILTQLQSELKAANFRANSLNYQLIRDQLASVQAVDPLTSRLARLLDLKTKTKIFRGLAHSLTKTVLADLDAGIVATKAAIEKERIATKTAEREAIRLIELQRIARKAQQVIALENKIFRDERRCLNRGCTSWIIP